MSTPSSGPDGADPTEPGSGSGAVSRKGEPSDASLSRWGIRTLAFCSAIGLAVIALGVHLLLPKLPSKGEISPQLVCAASMRGIVRSMTLYASEHGSLPGDPFRALLDSGEVTTKLYICPSSGKTVRDIEKDLYACFVPVAHDVPWWVEDTPASQAIVLYERDNHGGQGGNVVYADGHVEFIRPYSAMLRRVEESKRQMAEQRARVPVE